MFKDGSIWVSQTWGCGTASRPSQVNYTVLSDSGPKIMKKTTTIRDVHDALSPA